MKVYNYSFPIRIMGLSCTLAVLLVLLHTIFSGGSLERENGLPIFILIPLFLLMLILTTRSYYSYFYINEKGITNKLFGKAIFISWSEMKYIGVGESRINNRSYGADYRFLLYFSKTHPKEIYLVRDNIKQNKNQFFIIYREGLLEEILKYVDVDKIEHIDRIKHCSNPHQQQNASTSWSKSGNRDRKG